MVASLREYWPSVSPERFEETFESLPIVAQRAVKAGIDRTAAAAALLALSPALAAVGVAIKLDSEGGALFWQDRVGKDGRVFQICKFRTMRASRPTDIS